MVPSPSWFPTNLPARADWFANFTTQFLIVAASLGLASDAAQVEKDNAVMQFNAATFNQVSAFDAAMTQYRSIITEGATGETEPAIPSSPVFVLPDTVPTGIFQRLSELRDRIMSAKSYTPEIGALLNILPTQSAQIAPADAKATIKLFPAATGYTFAIVVANRAEADMWELYILRKGSAVWVKQGTYNGKSVDITLTATTPGEPEQMQARVQLRRNNQNYGQPSDAAYVTLNP